MSEGKNARMSKPFKLMKKEMWGQGEYIKIGQTNDNFNQDGFLFLFPFL